ncbi:MAG: sugar ABC transporter permease, partial [Eubacteriales bacterium]
MDKVSQKGKILGWVQKYTMIIILVLVVAFFASQKDGAILSAQNITNLVAQNAYVFILAVGMLLCILTGGNIDLSVGSVVCFAGGVGAVLMSNGTNMWVAVIAMLAIGTLIGAWQAYWIAFVRVPPFIVTLSGMLVFRGLSNVILGGKTVSVASQELFVQLFGGGASCYIPDIFGHETMNMLALVVGAIAVLIYLFFVVKGRMARMAKGYEVNSLLKTIIQTV